MTEQQGKRKGILHSTSLQHRIFFALAIACSVVAILVLVVSSLVYQETIMSETKVELSRECETLASVLNGDGVEEDSVSFLKSLDCGNVRLTLIAADGTVEYDSQSDASAMENHANRPEVADAQSSGWGSSERDSDTLGYVTLYEAVRLDSGEVLRLGMERSDVLHVIIDDFGFLILLVVAILGVVWLISRSLSRWLVRPILDIDLEGAMATSPYDELEPLVERLNAQYEALVGRMEQIQDADDMRREFTANVTHELKTPIASISGAAELIRDGIVKPEDVSDFAGRIYDDAQRLSSLVSDILTLSKLDESERAGDHALFGAMETVDLYGVATDVEQRYQDRAKDQGVTIRVTGTSTPIKGNPRLLDELVSNLVSNAVRYNRIGGKVFVWVLPENGKPCLRVSDTGIGIPEEAQSKVFERFYRVDKGRSREKGGTGLGLAIVKHAAAFHGATIDLKSELGKGTTITVTFPESSLAK
ncbi:MAG: ATP-binding protein [Tractidigestivibacter sp.]|uniref:sensor histidine kinase n=1 Tax=Tractidigestivibacter sp. TaxID=2847320 RepID=UPI003D909B3F